MFCNFCGKEIEDNAKFCSGCGKELVSSVQGSSVTSAYAWALATVPIAVSWILGLFVHVPTVVTVATIALNIVFISLDTTALKKSGKAPESWMWLGIVLVPLYLFVRAAKTDKNFGYAITWCGMFTLDFLISFISAL